jgi:hypothetical protein
MTAGLYVVYALSAVIAASHSNTTLIGLLPAWLW